MILVNHNFCISRVLSTSSTILSIKPCKPIPGFPIVLLRWGESKKRDVIRTTYTNNISLTRNITLKNGYYLLVDGFIYDQASKTTTMLQMTVVTHHDVKTRGVEWLRNRVWRIFAWWLLHHQ
jgi:hypothetical protein